MFKNYGDTETELKAKIQDLFEKAQKKWEGVFPDGARIELTPSHLAVCVASLEKVKLFNSNLEVVDDAFPLGKLHATIHKGSDILRAFFLPEIPAPRGAPVIRAAGGH